MNIGSGKIKKYSCCRNLPQLLRNLTPIQRIAIAEKYRDIIEDEAKKNYENNVGRPSKEKSLQKSSTINIIHTRDELSKKAGVSHDTYSKGKKILESDNEEIKQQVLSGEKKINTAYNELFGKKEDNKNLLKQLSCKGYLDLICKVSL